MKLELEQGRSGNRIDGYDAEGLRINGRLYTGTVLLTPSVLRPDLSLAVVEELDEATTQAILSLAPALLLIGTGARHRFPRPSALAPLLERGIGVEAMTTAAACRSFAVLVAEGRDVAALLMPPGHRR